MSEVKPIEVKTIRYPHSKQPFFTVCVGGVEVKAFRMLHKAEAHAKYLRGETVKSAVIECLKKFNRFSKGMDAGMLAKVDQFFDDGLMAPHAGEYAEVLAKIVLEYIEEDEALEEM